MSGEKRRQVTVVLPVFNEADNVGPVYARLAGVAAQRKDLDFEFLFVDDGSRDSTFAEVLGLRDLDARVSVIRLARNVGHQLALTAGLDASLAADAVIIMDADLQDPPEVALRLIERWESGAEVVYAQRRTRQDSTAKRVTAYVYYWLLSRISDVEIPRNVGDFRLMDRKVVVEVSRYREHDRYLRGIVAHVGFRQEAVLFDRDPRAAGKTGYTWRRMRKLAADGVLGFSTAPLRLISRVGVAISLFSAALGLYVLWVRLFHPETSVPGWAFLGVGMFMLGGLQLLMMGVIASYLGRVYVEAQSRPLYSITSSARGQAPSVLTGHDVPVMTDVTTG
ncbi:MAG TPA: glycosyltransferase family 2 protein [Nocardioides sp.]|nr:glycosyltransferase family 2 protein [Nocardioides sp.]